MPQSMTHVGVASGKKDREAEGATTVVYDAWTLNDYDPDSDGTGNDFDPSFEYGYSRVHTVDVYVADGSAYVAQYDHDQGAIRLYALDGTGEVGNNTTVDVDLRVEVRGN
jgi:hypothetical protein